MRKIFLAALLICAWTATAQATTVTLLSDDVTLNVEAWTQPYDFHYYHGPAGPGKYIYAYGSGMMGGSSYSGAGFYNTPTGDVSFAQVNTDCGMGLPLPLPLNATADIAWEFSVDEQLWIDISFTSMPGTGGTGNISITDNTTGLAVYSATVSYILDPGLSDSVLLEPGTTYSLDAFMSAGTHNPMNPVDLYITWNATFIPEPMTLMLLGLGALMLRAKRKN